MKIAGHVLVKYVSYLWFAKLTVSPYENTMQRDRCVFGDIHVYSCTYIHCPCVNMDYMCTIIGKDLV